MVHPDFEHKRSQQIDSLGIEVQEYTHKKTGAMHYHLKSDYDENVFFLGFRTMPMDSTGVAHILEHTALCGSEKYPVRDPFFMMIRRSLNTFMNAFTSSDWTAYPFASKNKKDFNNLLSVYLDAAFHSSLDPLDFAQEGHRLEHEVPNDPSTPIQFKGVVYNEMKGAMSSVTSQLWQTFSKYLYPTVTYHYNSGGDPESILDLQYDDLIQFYKKHYHPSNAMFMTFGDIPASEHHEQFAKYLNEFEALGERFSVPNEKRYFAPVRVEESYGSKELENKTHHVMGWLLGESSDLDAQLEAHFLSALLLENSSSALRRELETTELGTGPSPLCGLEDRNKEMCFVCGIEGSEPERKEDLEALVLQTLEKVKKEGVSDKQVEAVLHQLELSQREIGGDGYPYGLQLIMSSIAACTHYSDPAELLDLDPAIDKLRLKIEDKQFLPDLIDRLLLNNPHRVTLTFKPDSKIDERKKEAEEQRLANIVSALSDAERQEILSQGIALQERQKQQDDDSILPKVSLDDVSDSLVIPTGTKKDGEHNITLYETGTNGMTYHQVIMPLPALSAEEQGLMPLLMHSMTELGCAGEDYIATQERQSLVSGGISAYQSIRPSTSDIDECKAYWVLSGKALSRNHGAFFELMQDTLNSVDFSDSKRIREIAQYRLSRKEQSVTGNGHGLAMNVAASGTSSLARMQYEYSGLPAILSMRDHVSRLEQDAQTVVAELAALYKKLTNAPQQHLVVSDEKSSDDAVLQLQKTWLHTQGDTVDFKLPLFEASEKKTAWVVPSQTNFCAKVFPTVNSDHPDSAALTVLGSVLRNGYLHTSIREQGGAYGGGASQDNNLAVFKFYSYRDPRFKGTLDDFDRALTWFEEQTDTLPQLLEEAILGVVSSIDKPGSPAGEARQAFHGELNGRTPEWRNQYRKRIMDVTLGDVHRVAKEYLSQANASYGVLISREQAESAEKLGFEIKEL
ncbi:peptidase M16 [Bermanella marisrubri]|uniref:Predicted Zn-dependent peptidase, insulinase-like protein n=1 Tax=Bermanella marisrubri TaxID=207949 RepID=Q1N4L8_9GAMM|nr:insulinase family protein [Bermanella marisrubri]EAT13410.1 predicted Zn-dependent peptidase, insulinase-like protein [Oceanobacter sp. RED65] [Bermanella marisrubri]QIZ84160.1 peptidase M16 [Bermanella marisrubri]